MEELEFWQRDPSELDEDDLDSFSSRAVLTSNDWTTETLLWQLKRGNIELSPRFQRREAWVDRRKIQFIESLFLGLPVPQIVLAERRDQRGSFMVLDGKQRLLSIRRFGVESGDQEFEPLRLTGLLNRKDLNGHTWASLSEDSNFHWDLVSYQNEPIRTIVVRDWPDESFLYLVFLRLNSNSVPLSSQELRQVFHPGPFTDFVDRFSSDSSAIKNALRIDKPDFRMRDVEILIRFFAFADSIRAYNGNLRYFLDNACRVFNDNWGVRQVEVESMAKDCEFAIDTTISIFGDDAFRRWRGPDRFERSFNRAVFDIMTYYFRDETVGNLAIEKREDIVRHFIELCTTDEQFNTSLQSTTKSISATFERLTKWGQRLQDILNIELDIPQPEYSSRRRRA